MFKNQYAGKRVLVTGHTGFKGAWLSQWLISLGASVCGYSLYLPSNPALFDVLALSDQMRDVRGDIRDLEGVTKAFIEFEPEIVFHLAAQPLVFSAYDDPKTTYDTNVTGTVNVLEAIRACGSVEAAVMITSDKCYDNVEWEYGYRETDRLGGKDPYSASKACAEIIIQSYWQSYFKNMEVALASVRAGNVIGGGDWADNRLIPDAMKAWSDDKTLFVRSPNATRPWQHVLEPLSGYLWLGVQLYAKNESVMGEAFNFGPDSKSDYSVSQMLEALKERWGNQGMIEYIKSIEGPSEATLLKLSCDKALQRLGWQSTLNFNQLGGFVVDWYKAFYSDKDSMLELTLEQIWRYEEISKTKNCVWTNDQELVYV